MEVNLLYCVCAFFGLSFVFQLVAMIPYGGGYNKIFVEKQSTDNVKFEDVSEDKRNEWFLNIVHFNWLRFIEYSISGSLVLFTIALVSGVVDFELLLCIFFLSLACMILGLIAEWCMRIEVVIQNMDFEKVGWDQKLYDIIRRFLRRSFWFSHILAWICIIVPWFVPQKNPSPQKKV